LGKKWNAFKRGLKKFIDILSEEECENFELKQNITPQPRTYSRRIKNIIS
jgi:hypothetical protein